MTMNDDDVRKAAPRGWGTDPVAADLAAQMARATVAGNAGRTRRPRLRALLGGTILGFGVLGIGVTAAVAGPTIAEWVGWTPDVVAQRTFQFDDIDGARFCEVFVRVTAEYGSVSDDVADQNVEEARRFLTDHDWAPAIASITSNDVDAAYELEVEQRSNMSSTPAPPPATKPLVASSLMFNRVRLEFERAGQFRPGVALEGAGSCGDATGPTTEPAP